LKGTKTQTNKKEGRESKKEYNRGNFGVPGERQCKIKKNDGEI
jgi:hypothetical protein